GQCRRDDAPQSGGRPGSEPVQGEDRAGEAQGEGDDAQGREEGAIAPHAVGPSRAPNRNSRGNTSAILGFH
ncbi:hypothetical protein, partial [Pseudomonas syringae group genomosp. 7]|uniref:hypothetical protein n=1 Tax=Pseudomonas syringae group genomosp. 7 TaxID=251699 RepID=UPI00376FCDB3